MAELGKVSKAKKSAVSRPAAGSRTSQAKGRTLQNQTPDPVSKDHAVDQWGNLIGVGTAVALHGAMTRSIETASKKTFAFSKGSLENGVAATIAVLEAKSVADAVDIQTAHLYRAWDEALDFWTQMGATGPEWFSAP